MSERRSTIDWEGARARLEHLRRTLEGGGEPPPEEARRVLLERARALARVREEPPAPAEMLDLLVFSLGGDRYGVETASVLEVFRLRELTPVPCTPGFMPGVLSYRGRILPVLDLHRLLGRPGLPPLEARPVVAVEAGGMSFGILTDAVAGTVRTAREEIAMPPASLLSAGAAFIRGVTTGMVAVVDLEALALDPRLVVNEEVG